MIIEGIKIELRPFLQIEKFPLMKLRISVETDVEKYSTEDEINLSYFESFFDQIFDRCRNHLREFVRKEFKEIENNSNIDSDK